MKTFKQILSEMDKRFGTPEDPRLNINDPQYDYTGRYDPAYLKNMQSPTTDTDSESGLTTRDTEKSKPIRRVKNVGPKPMTFQQIADRLGMGSHQNVEQAHNKALEKLRRYFINNNETL
jgi:DNA-directed RNA polymerase sigma subunit (sigma70/sigma32)